MVQEQLFKTNVDDLKSVKINNRASFRQDNMSLLNQIINNRDRKEIIKKAREYVKNIGLLYRIIKLKTDFIASGLKLSGDNEDYFRELYDELNMQSFVRSASDELQIVGEFYPFKSFDKNNNPVNFSLLDPLRTEVKTIMGKDLIYLSPSAEIQNMLNSNVPEERKLIQKVIPKKIQKKWMKGEKALLEEEVADRYYLSKPDFQKHPNSPIEAIFKDLELLETLISADYSNAQKLKSILHAKVGDKDVNQGIMPKEAIEAIDDLLDQPNSNALELVTQWFVQFEYVSTNPETFTEEKYKAVTKRILDWSNINVFVEEGGSYGQGFIKIKSLRQDVENKRSLIVKALNDFNKQVALKKGWTTYGGKPKIPEIKFDNNSMLDDDLIFKINKWLVQQGIKPIETVIKEYGYNYEKIKKMKEKEIAKYGDMDNNIWRPLFEASQSLLSEQDGSSNPSKKSDPKTDSQPRP